MWRIENDEDSAGGAVFVCKEDLVTRLDNVLLRTYDEPLAEVVADALNVHEATGLTPSQLQARVAELEAALHRVRHEVLVECAEICRAVGSRATQFEAEDCADEIEELLSK